MDPIADMFTKILNAARRGKESVIISYSGLKAEIARLLKDKGFIYDVDKKGRKVRKFLELILRYENKVPAISGFKRISKPSRRIYAKSTDLFKLNRGGTLIVSTSKGIMTGEEAMQKKLGGEVIGMVW